MKKISLIAPGTNPDYATQEPLNLGLLASYLEAHGVEVSIIDELAGQNIEEELKKFKPDIAGITAVTPLVPDAYRIAELCRKMGIKTVMGGVHASILPEEALQHVDTVVKGEGERALLDIVLDKTTERIVERPYIKNIDEIPPPARHLMQSDFYLRGRDRFPRSYLRFCPPGTKTAAILSSRGCPYACAFCHNTWRGMPCRYNSPERVLLEIRTLMEKYGVGAIFFIEDNLFVNKKRLEAICNLIIDNKINLIWGGNSRVDNIDTEILTLAKKAGCHQVTFGFESGSQRTLNFLNKQTTVEQNQRAVDLCRKVGIRPQGSVIIGSPGETTEDIRQTQDFIRRNHFEGEVGVSIATPFPGTKLWEWCVQNNRIPPSFKWSDFNYGDAPIRMCDAISPAELKRLRIETKHLESRINLRLAMKKLLTSPGETIKKAFNNPKKILRQIKSIFAKK